MPVSETQSVERETRGWVSVVLRAAQGEQRTRSCERLDTDVQAGLQAKQGLRSAGGEAQMEGGSAEMQSQTGPRTE